MTVLLNVYIYLSWYIELTENSSPHYLGTLYALVGVEKFSSIFVYNVEVEYIVYHTNITFIHIGDILIS